MKRFFVIFFVTAVSLFMAIIPFISSAGPISFDNPLKSKDAMALLNSIVDQLTPLAAIIAALAILFTGFKYVVAVSGGQAEPAKKAKELFVPVLIGAAILVGGSTILKAIVTFVQGF